MRYSNTAMMSRRKNAGSPYPQTQQASYVTQVAWREVFMVLKSLQANICHCYEVRWQDQIVVRILLPANKQPRLYDTRIIPSHCPYNIAQHTPNIHDLHTQPLNSTHPLPVLSHPIPSATLHSHPVTRPAQPQAPTRPQSRHHTHTNMYMHAQCTPVTRVTHHTTRTHARILTYPSIPAGRSHPGLAPSNEGYFEKVSK